MKLQAPLAAALLLTVCIVPGCDKKRDECNKVADVANKAVTEMHKLEAEMRSEADDPVALAKDAKAFVDLAEKASKDISAIEITTEGLKPHVEAYTSMLDASAVATKALLADLEQAGDLSADKIAATQKSLEDAQAGIAKACENGAPDCEKIFAAMQAMGENPSADDIGKMFADHAAALKELNIEDAGLKEAKQGYIAVIDEFVRLMAIADRINANVEKVDAAVAKEDEIVAAINQFCGAT